ncbi:LPS export ABC transporter periplasmic protein LptC [Variovorax sp. PCZ-1]|uniref:LPS export ABC transporter periplasmic protein LptC n=1 Tax=Variovorax sp. PCZ-1 TaxID=2835533 RepID=UPI001BCD652C|nr:LPS export ABC transporter periplasmic protein LptC [Variovorax sp. PCZ-1]MBS7808668.1 LPS export ABC transporter periplasmic protein LptC [Variovorax sp. PCZ-1]
MSSANMLRKLVGNITLYLPMALMGVLALGSWWLARNTPVTVATAPQQIQRQEPDYFLTKFSVKSFDPQGQLMSEVWGEKARHFPATDILEVDAARFRSLRSARVIFGQGDRAYSNGDGSEVQLVGNALVIREAALGPQGRQLPRMEFRGEFLHAFLRTEEVKSHKPVTMLRGSDQFSGDAMLYNKIDGTVQLDGRVRVRLEAKPSTDSR